jgi:molybdopterin molybdotransferase
MSRHQSKTTSGTSPAALVAGLAAKLTPVGIEPVDLASTAGRILADNLTADRDSPDCSVSVMDGYALRLADTRAAQLPILGEVRIGRAPPALPPGGVLRIATGAPLPPGADAVVRREDVEESADHIVLRAAVNLAAGHHIRRQAENLAAGQTVAAAGTTLSPALLAAAAAFGVFKPKVFRRVRLALLITGDEVLPPDARPEPWQLRDTNGPALQAMFSAIPWIELCSRQHVLDDLNATRAALTDALAVCDAVVMTGGVSMGLRDFAQIAVNEVGARLVFHRLPIRPGAPMLGAVGPGGQAIIGLPGNPVSALVTARRFASILLRRLAGCAVIDPSLPLVHNDQPELADANLWLYPPVAFCGPGAVTLLPSKGSGDIVSAGRADGFVEIAPDSQGQSLHPFYSWEL